MKSANPIDFHLIHLIVEKLDMFSLHPIFCYRYQ